MTAIAVLGAGNVGATLARKWAAAGHHVTLASRNPDVAALRDLATGIGTQTARHLDAVERADVVVVALPGDAVAAVAESLGSALDGKIVIDATNNLAAPEPNNLAAITAPRPARSPPGRSTPSAGRTSPTPTSTVPRPTCCGADPTATSGALIEALIADIGLRPVRVGGLDQLHLVDMLAGLWFALALGQQSRPPPRLQSPHPVISGCRCRS